MYEGRGIGGGGSSLYSLFDGMDGVRFIFLISTPHGPFQTISKI